MNKLKSGKPLEQLEELNDIRIQYRQPKQVDKHTAITVTADAYNLLARVASVKNWSISELASFIITKTLGSQDEEA